MAEVNDLRTFALQNATHNIDGSIMTIKKEAAVTIRILLVGVSGIKKN